MIPEFVELFMARAAKLESMFAEKHPENYRAIVEAVVTVLAEGNDNYSVPDPKRIHEIDDGNYQGTLVYVIGAAGYQPSDYWYVKVGYGSCSGCDTLLSIRGYGDDKPTAAQVRGYMTLALHVVQGMKRMGDDLVDGSADHPPQSGCGEK